MSIHRTASLLLLSGLVACTTTTTSIHTRPAQGPAVPAAMPAVPLQAPTPASPAVPMAAMPEPVAIAEPIAAPVPPVATATATPAPAKPRPAMPKPKPQAVAKPVAAAEPVPAKAAAAGLAGKLELVAGARERVVAGEVSEGLVYFLPKSGGTAPKPGAFSVDTRSKGFSPSVLVIPVGSTVRFPNRDSILHNVFSRTPGSTFDFGFYGPGESKQRVFAKPGLVIVNCNVHHNMRADIVVLATPYYTRPDRNGRYSLQGLPKGPGTLVFWHPRADAQQVTVSLPQAAPVTRRLVASKPSRHDGMGH